MNDHPKDLPPMLGALMRRALRALSDHVERALVTAGFDDLRPAHLAVFQHMDAGGSRVTDLAQRALMTKQSMSALVDDLERWGYMERTADPTDGRARLVRRTARGWDVERTAREAVRGFEAAWEAEVGEKRMRIFREVLDAFPA